MVSGNNSQSITVLIVEDDLRIAEINKRFVEKIAGYQVIGVATDEQQAKEQLHILQPDLVLLDIYFPDTNGLTILSHIHQHHHDTDVIMITAAKEVHTVRESMRNGVFDYIVKPIVFERFEKTMQSYKEFHRILSVMQSEERYINQEQIDGLMKKGSRTEEQQSRMPKGIDKITLDKVIAVMEQEQGGLTAEEVGKKIGISRPTARRYLEHLIAEEQVEPDLSYGEIGRPERLYRRIQKG